LRPVVAAFAAALRTAPAPAGGALTLQSFPAAVDAARATAEAAAAREMAQQRFIGEAVQYAEATLGELLRRERGAALEALQLAASEEMRELVEALSTDLDTNRARIEALLPVQEQLRAALQETQAQLAASDARIRDLQSQLQTAADDLAAARRNRGRSRCVVQ
jgi:chromosome segregation ATPase